MSDILILPSGGGSGSDDCTATRAQLLSGYTGILSDTDDEPGTGTMVNRGAVSQSLPINGSYTIPQGYHNGSGKVTQSIPTQGQLTINPGTTQKTGNVSGKYMTGNIIVPAISIPASYIKKNQVITLPDGSQITGAFEGYVPVATDLYLRGQNPGGLNEQHGSSISFDEGQITLSGTVSKTLHFANNVSFVGFTRLNFEVYRGNDTSSQTRIEVMEGTPGSTSEGAKSSTILASTSPGNYTMSIDISALQMSRAWYIRVISLNYTTSSTHGAIYHIWLS